MMWKKVNQWLSFRRSNRVYLSLSLLGMAFSYYGHSPLSAHAQLGQPLVLENWQLLENTFNGLNKREKQTGSLRMTHIGDSHIIADFWTGEMRTRLQKRFGDGGRGFVLGGEMWRSYGQRHIWHYTQGEWEVTNLKRGRDTSVFGPGGAALICAKSSCITGIETREGQRAAHFDILDVFTLGHGQGGYYKLNIDHKDVSEHNTFSPWLTVLRQRTWLPLRAHKVQISPTRKTGEVWLFGFSLKNSQGGLIYDSIGLNGSQAKHLLKNHDEALRTAFHLLDSQLLIISFGINEVFDRHFKLETYTRYLHLLMSALRNEASPHKNIECLLTGPFAARRRGRSPPELEDIYKVQRQISVKYGCAFWDSRAAMGGSIKPWQKRKLARKDGVHLSRKGYSRIAELFEKSLLLSYEEWKTQKRTHSLTSQPSIDVQPIQTKYNLRGE